MDSKEILRNKFFKECTQKDSIDGVKFRIDIAPHDLFEWFVKNMGLLNNNSDAVEFCEWASLVYYEGIGEQKGFWFDDRGECVATSTSELYKIFKSLPSPPIQQTKI